MRFVYLATNDEFRPDLVKIGVADNVEERMRSLRGSGVPGHYEAKCICKVHNAEIIEQKIHNLLQHARVRNDREFFRVDWLFAAGILLTLALEEERENNAKPELAKWMREELSSLTKQSNRPDETPSPIVPTSPPRPSPPRGGSGQSDNGRDIFEHYLRNNVRSDTTVRANITGLEYLNRHNLIDEEDIYKIFNIARLQEILAEVANGTIRTDVHNGAREMRGHVCTALRHYIKCRQQHSREHR